jgi:hypothetical protein
MVFEQLSHALPSYLVRRVSVTVFVLLVALPFNRSPIPHTSLLVGELFVLLIRILMPVHVICSVLQATSLSKVRPAECCACPLRHYFGALLLVRCCTQSW